jgi:hypothetical protein
VVPTGEIDPERVEQLQQMVRVSTKLKVSRIADVLNIEEKTLWQHVFKWAEEYGFTVNKDTLNFQDGQKEEFLASLEQDLASRALVEPKSKGKKSRAAGQKTPERVSIGTQIKSIHFKDVIRRKGKIGILAGILVIVGLQLTWFMQIVSAWGFPYYTTGMGYFSTGVQGLGEGSLYGLQAGGDIMLTGGIIAIAVSVVLFLDVLKNKLHYIGRIALLAGGVIVLDGFVVYLLAGMPLFSFIPNMSFFTDFSVQIGFVITLIGLILAFVGGIAGY